MSDVPRHRAPRRDRPWLNVLLDIGIGVQAALLALILLVAVITVLAGLREALT